MKYSQAKAILLALRKAGWEKAHINKTYLKSFYLADLQQTRLITFEEISHSRLTPHGYLSRMRRKAMDDLTRGYYKTNGIYGDFVAFTVANNEMESMPVDTLDRGFDLFRTWKDMPVATVGYEDIFLELRGYRSGNTGDYQVLERLTLSPGAKWEKVDPYAVKRNSKSITSIADYDILAARSGVYLHPKEGGKD